MTTPVEKGEYEMTEPSSRHNPGLDGEPLASPVERQKPSMWLRILQLEGTAHSIALGTATGLFVAMTPTVGLQMVIILLISLVIPVNRLAGFTMVYVSNPLTMIPIYWLDYWVGLKCLAQEGMSRADFEQRWLEAQSKAGEVGWYEWCLELLRSIGNDVLGPMFLGGAVVGLICALPTYPVTLRLVRRYRAMKQERVALRAPAAEFNDKESNG
ncbi:MAG: DUF2062 domain-containing protein [Planctomycetota bacterium]|nr:DUF2062 domain-containing protein [Planctomycetota bacterium]